MSSKDEEATKPKLLWGTQDMAAFLGVSDRRLQQLVDEGVAVREARGKYNALETISNYLALMRDGGGGEVVDDKAALVKEQRRWTKIRADKDAAALAILHGEIVMIEDACALLAEEAGSVRAALEGEENQLVDKFSGRILEPAEVAIELRASRERAFKHVTLDTDNPRRPVTKEVPQEFLNDDTDIEHPVPGGDAE
ncbi:hypothetical protein BXY70_1333 [Roseovarius halotolerans]|uniref:Phage DNA packaging protein Nu1 n=1 Tax=Roseovarius halotolerans TaxID=505353 RepID=A0A1X6Y654_9RHOB|nr:hypothetical protein [Roseovarius halotolerans]RKT35300.1 hypothetical protein BXY70_1333 [Roseovarius halotolerans]SLN11118.1 hypothetical protein ROH8110_00063 [Roseovarius halotolerans]